MKKRIFKTIGLLTFFYAILVFAGGVMGFVMKQSTPSLVAGTFFGLTLLFTSIKTLTFHRYGLILTLLTTLVLDTFFSYRYLTSQKFIPAGMMLLVTSFVLLVMILQLYQLKKLVKGS